MITKLKFLKAYFTRNILPAPGTTIGKILYTGKNAVGRRPQYVIDLDTKVATLGTIDAAPANPLTSPGAIITGTTIAPATDANMYIFGGLATLPTLTQVIGAEYSQDIANGTLIVGIDIAVNITASGTAVYSATASNGLTLTGSVVSLDDNLTAGTYTLDYLVADIDEPQVNVTGTITVIVQP
jgi:hypothetical protein